MSVNKLPHLCVPVSSSVLGGATAPTWGVECVHMQYTAQCQPQSVDLHHHPVTPTLSDYHYVRLLSVTQRPTKWYVGQSSGQPDFLQAVGLGSFPAGRCLYKMNLASPSPCSADFQPVLLQPLDSELLQGGDHRTNSQRYTVLSAH